ncbi:MAG: hypothetical protein RI575_13740 [Balneolaceae bacterium]|nr:hypothetical protein [Balneolaceae bacterium]
MEQQVIDARKRLERQGIAQTGAIAISYELPNALQMDNELAFRGSNRYPRSFGTVIRLALALGIAPVFIPVGEPWRNGIIERFNHTWDRRFFDPRWLPTLSIWARPPGTSVAFITAIIAIAPWDIKLRIKSPRGCYPPMFYEDRFNLEERIPLKEGSVYFVRFIRSDCKLHLPIESFRVDQILKYSFVVAEISVENHCLFVRQNNQIIQTFEYLMPVDW